MFVPSDNFLFVYPGHSMPKLGHSWQDENSAGWLVTSESGEAKLAPRDVFTARNEQQVRFRFFWYPRRKGKSQISGICYENLKFYYKNRNTSGQRLQKPDCLLESISLSWSFLPHLQSMQSFNYKTYLYI